MNEKDLDFIINKMKAKKQGSQFVAKCPFHNEITPSLSINPDKRVWYCFGCNKGGTLEALFEKMGS